MQGIEWVYFGGGEPFTQYPLLLKAIQRARKLDYRVGVETNGYFARTDEAGLRLLRPLANMGVEDLRVSNDSIHYQKPETSPANRALAAARKLGIPTTLVSISPPGFAENVPAPTHNVDRIDELRFMYAGRASETFAEQEAGIELTSLTSCPRNDLADPDRVYIDAYGFVQICPGIAIGNACQDPLQEILPNYDVTRHEILGELYKNGPAGLIEISRLPVSTKIVDPCHGCFSSRKQLIDQYPDVLGPRHVYGY
jgi:hypothetical protein